jgi:hypothetical protein
VCSNLIAGWNACAWNIDGNNTLKGIYDQAGASVVASWNYTGGSFVSYLGNSTNAGVNVTYGDVVWIYVSTATSWEQNWTATNYSKFFTRNIYNWSFVNTTPVGVRNFTSLNLKTITDRVNSSCDLVYSTTLFYQPTGRYTPFFCGYNESNSTMAPFGSVLWIDWNATRNTFFNWTG